MSAEEAPPAGRAPSRIWLNEALIVSALTAFAYALIFAFDAGYALHFQLPVEYISIGPSQLAGVAVVLILSFNWLLTGLLATPTDIPAWLGSRRIRGAASWVVAGAAAAVAIYAAGWIPWQAMIIAFLVGFALAIAASAVQSRLKASTVVHTVTVADPFYYMMCAVAMSLALAFGLGIFVARSQRDFLVIADGPYRGFAIVWTANDLVFLARCDFVKHVIAEQMVLTRVEKGNDLKWSTRTVGPFRSAADLAERP
jgi:hypothetical protein